MVRRYTIDRTKKFAVVDNGRIISKHIDFYNAQEAVERHLRDGKISNNYYIISLSELRGGN